VTSKIQLCWFKPDLEKIAIYCHVELEKIHIKLKKHVYVEQPSLPTF